MTQNDHKRNTADVFSHYSNLVADKGTLATNAVGGRFLLHQAAGPWIE